MDGFPWRHGACRHFFGFLSVSCDARFAGNDGALLGVSSLIAGLTCSLAHARQAGGMSAIL